MNWINKTHASTLSFATEKKKQQQFLWLMGSIVFAVFIYQYYLIHTFNRLPLIIGGVFIAISFIVPLLAFPFLYIWMFIGRILSEITSTLILGVIYFLILTPAKFLKKTDQHLGWVQPKEATNFNEQF